MNEGLEKEKGYGFHRIEISGQELGLSAGNGVPYYHLDSNSTGIDTIYPNTLIEIVYNTDDHLYRRFYYLGTDKIEPDRNGRINFRPKDYKPQQMLLDCLVAIPDDFDIDNQIINHTRLLERHTSDAMIEHGHSIEDDIEKTDNEIRESLANLGCNPIAYFSLVLTLIQRLTLENRKNEFIRNSTPSEYFERDLAFFQMYKQMLLDTQDSASNRIAIDEHVDDYRITAEEKKEGRMEQ